MTRNLLTIFLMFFLFVAVPGTKGQKHDKKQGVGAPDPQLSQKDNEYIDRQDKVFLDTIQ